MKALLLALLVWQAGETLQAADPEQRFFRYQRDVTLSAPTESAAQDCVTLDGSVYAHAAPTLKDVRLYEDKREVPYAITLSESLDAESEPAKVLNLGMHGRKIAFDLQMPARPYTDVMLDLGGHNFIASAEVTGLSPTSGTPTHLGTFSLFDLSAQQLSRSTTLHLQESTFSLLHLELSVIPAPGSPTFPITPALVQGASVPPSREAQTVYTTVAETSTLSQRGHQTVATFRLPAHVPVERISVQIAPTFSANFSRNVTITGRTIDTPGSAAETLTGRILRVRMKDAGQEIHQEELHVPATLGANLQTDAAVEVRIDNGNDAALPVVSVRLEMRQRRLCFAEPALPALTLFYGDSALEAPVYDYNRLFSPTGQIALAHLGVEQPNALFTPRPEATRTLLERHPEILWIVLLAVVCVLAAIALHSSKLMPK